MSLYRFLPAPLATFFAVAAMSLSAQAPPGGPWRGFRLEEATIESVQTALRSGQLSCRTLVDGYLKRIEAYNHSGPALNAIQNVNPRAFAEADRLDAVSSQAFAEFLLAEHHCDISCKARDDILRQTGRPEQRVPRSHVKAGIARLADGGQVGQS